MDILMVELEQLEDNLQKFHLSYSKWLKEFQESATVNTVTAGGGAVTGTPATSKPALAAPKPAEVRSFAKALKLDELTTDIITTEIT